MSIAEENGLGSPTARADETAESLTADILAGLASGLESLNHKIEGEFLGIGTKLIECISTVDLMSSDLTSLAASIGGDHVTRASHALTRALSLSAEMQTRAEEGKGQLAKMAGEAKTLGSKLADLSSIVSAFHSLGLLTRIETKRLRDIGLDLANLAEDVRSLALNVRSKVKSALETAAELTPRIEGALAEVASTQEVLLQELHSVVSQVSTRLGKFHGMQDLAHAASIRLAIEYRELSNSFRKLIVCLQFHDITRQRLEHVISALRRVSSHYREGKAVGEHGSATAAAVLELQSLQLADAAEKFNNAVQSVAVSLDEIMLNIQKMINEARALSGFPGEDQSPFFQEMEKGCLAILNSLNRCATAEGTSGLTTTSLIEIIARNRASLEDIRVIETQMQRTGMNALISARQLGAPGEALSALANAIKQKAFESRNVSDDLLKTLDVLSQAANQSYEQHQPQAVVEKIAHEQCLEQLRAAVADLRASHQSSCGKIEEVTGRGDRLSESIRTARATFAIGAHFAGVVSSTQDELRTIVEQARTQSGGNAGTAAVLGITEFVGQYTMQGEVDIYQGLMKALGSSVPGAGGELAAVTTSGEDDEFGDNVELF